MRFFWLILACFGAGGALQAQIYHQFDFDSSGIKEFTLPFRAINNLVLLPVMFNECDTLYFILDSGAENTTVFGAEFPKPPVDTSRLRRIKILGPGQDASVAAFISPGNTLRIGPISGDDLNVVYIPEDFVQFSELLGHDVHGILGVQLFHDFAIRVDYYKREVTFTDPEHFKPRRRFKPLPVYLIGGRPFIDLFIEVHPRINMTTNLLVDLGESKPLSLFLSTHEAFILPYPNYQANLGKGLNGIVTGRVARVSRLVIDQYELRQVLTAFPDLEATQFLTADDRRNGSLGAGILKRFVTVFDLPHERIYLKRTSLLRQPFSFDKTGMILVAEGEKFDRFRISGVLKGTPAERAGLAKDDLLLAVNGEPVDGLKLGEVLDLIERGGRKIHLNVQRGDDTLERRLHISRLR